MPFEPMSLPYWTVPAWNPNVNEARANGEYPTAAWANQLQALHDAEVAKINEVGALAESVSDSIGVVGETHLPGTILIAGEDGYLKPLPPGTLHQVLHPNSNNPDGIEWRDELPTGTAVAGSVLVFDGDAWATVPVGASSPGAVNGGFLRYDDRAAAKVSWSADATMSAAVELHPIAKAAPPANYWAHTATPWFLSRTLAGSAIQSPSTFSVISARNAGLYTAIPNGSEILLATIPPVVRPAVQKTPGPATIYNAATGASAGSMDIYVNTDGTIVIKFPVSGGPFSLTSATVATACTVNIGNYTL